MSRLADDLRHAVISRTLQGRGVTSLEARAAAFANAGMHERVRALLDKVARHAWTVTDADVAAVTASGVTDDEVFELTVCAALGQATRQRDAALAALQAAVRTDGVEAAETTPHPEGRVEDQPRRTE